MAGRIQNEDVKTLAELLAAGGQKNQLTSASKIYVAAKALGLTVDEFINLEFEAPLRIAQGQPADSKLYFSPTEVEAADGTGRSIPALKGIIPSIPASTLDFQTKTTTGGTFDLSTWPASTVGQVRRVGFTVLSSGEIKALFTPEAASLTALNALGNVANPGSVFVKGGLPVGWLEIECTDATPGAEKFKTLGSTGNVIENKVGANFRIHKFGAGGGAGGGSGTGDTTAIEEELKALHRQLNYKWHTPNVFAKHETARVDGTSTAQSQITEDNLYLFSAANQFVLSKQCYDTQFLASDLPSRQVILSAFWEPSAIDPNAVYQVSRNGGANWQTMSMDRVGNSNHFRGSAVFADESTLSTLASQPTATSNLVLNTTTARNYAFPLTLASKSALRKLTVHLSKTGTPTGNFYVRVVKQSGSLPSLDGNDIMWESAPQSIASVASGNTTAVVTMDKVLPSGTYWVVVDTDQAYRNSFVSGTHQLSVRATNSGATADSAVYNGTAWSVSTNNDIAFVAEGITFDLRVKISSSAGGFKLLGYGVFYGEITTGYATGLEMLQQFTVNGNADTYEFTLTKFLPDAQHLRVYDVNAGQVWRYPAFAVDGKKVTFAPGSFLAPGEQITLIFDQTQGAGFDNSDKNAALLAANRLGSTDPSIDRSVAGEGPLLRADNGKQVEISVKWNGTGYELVLAEVQ